MSRSSEKAETAPSAAAGGGSTSHSNPNNSDLVIGDDISMNRIIDYLKDQ